MKPQTMTLVRFFNELCFELDLDPDKSDEHTVIEAVKNLKTELDLEKAVSTTNYAACQKVKREYETLVDELTHNGF